MGEGSSTSYIETNLHVSDTYPDGVEYSVQKVQDVRKIYTHKVHKDNYLYFVKVVISHPDEDMLDAKVYNAGDQVTVNYNVASPFMQSHTFP